MSETKDRRRRLVPSVNTVRKRVPPSNTKIEIAASVKSPEPNPGKSPATIPVAASTSKKSEIPPKAQVFVLSPAILKKMGINIGSLKINTASDGIPQKKKRCPQTPKESSKTDKDLVNVKKTLHDKLTKKNFPVLPINKINSDSNILAEKSFKNKTNCAITLVQPDSPKPSNTPQNLSFSKPESPVKNNYSTNMETVSYVTSSMIMSPGEDISHYISGYKKIPETLHSAISNQGTNYVCTKVSSDNVAKEQTPLNVSSNASSFSNNVSKTMHDDSKGNDNVISEVRQENGHFMNHNIVNEVRYEFVDNAYAVSDIPVISQQYYTINSDQNSPAVNMQYLSTESSKIYSASQDVNPAQIIENASLAVLPHPFSVDLENDNSLESDINVDISGSNDETFDYIIEDVNSDEIEKVDLLNVDLDLLHKETNSGNIESQPSYYCPMQVVNELPPTLVSSHDRQQLTYIPINQVLPPFEIISPASTLKKYMLADSCNSPNSNIIHKNLELFLNSFDQNMEYPQQSNSFTEQNMNDISENSPLINNLSNTDSFRNMGEVSVSNKVNQETRNERNVKIQESEKHPSPLPVNTKPLVAVSSLQTDKVNKKDMRVYTPLKYSPKCVIKHSSIKEPLQSASTLDNQLHKKTRILPLIEKTLSPSIKPIGLGKCDIKNKVVNYSESLHDKFKSQINVVKSQQNKQLKSDKAVVTAPNKTESINKIANYLKQFKDKTFNASDNQAETQITKKRDSGDKNVQEIVTLRDEMMHGVEEPGGKDSFDGTPFTGQCKNVYLKKCIKTKKTFQNSVSDSTINIIDGCKNDISTENAEPSFSTFVHDAYEDIKESIDIDHRLFEDTMCDLNEKGPLLSHSIYEPPESFIFQQQCSTKQNRYVPLTQPQSSLKTYTRKKRDKFIDTQLIDLPISQSNDNSSAQVEVMMDVLKYDFEMDYLLPRDISNERKNNDDLLILNICDSASLKQDVHSSVPSTSQDHVINIGVGNLSFDVNNKVANNTKLPSVNCEEIDSILTPDNTFSKTIPKKRFSRKNTLLQDHQNDLHQVFPTSQECLKDSEIMILCNFSDQSNKINEKDFPNDNEIHENVIMNSQHGKSNKLFSVITVESTTTVKQSDPVTCEDDDQESVLIEALENSNKDTNLNSFSDNLNKIKENRLSNQDEIQKHEIIYSQDWKSNKLFSAIAIESTEMTKKSDSFPCEEDKIECILIDTLENSTVDIQVNNISDGNENSLESQITENVDLSKEKSILESIQANKSPDQLPKLHDSVCSKEESERMGIEISELAPILSDQGKLVCRPPKKSIIERVRSTYLETVASYHLLQKKCLAGESIETNHIIEEVIEKENNTDNVNSIILEHVILNPSIASKNQEDNFTDNVASITSDIHVENVPTCNTNSEVKGTRKRKKNIPSAIQTYLKKKSLTSQRTLQKDKRNDTDVEIGLNKYCESDIIAISQIEQTEKTETLTNIEDIYKLDKEEITESLDNKKYFNENIDKNHTLTPSESPSNEYHIDIENAENVTNDITDAEVNQSTQINSVSFTDDRQMSKTTPGNMEEFTNAYLQPVVDSNIDSNFENIDESFLETGNINEENIIYPPSQHNDTDELNDSMDCRSIISEDISVSHLDDHVIDALNPYDDNSPSRNQDLENINEILHSDIMQSLPNKLTDEIPQKLSKNENSDELIKISKNSTELPNPCVENSNEVELPANVFQEESELNSIVEEPNLLNNTCEMNVKDSDDDCPLSAIKTRGQSVAPRKHRGRPPKKCQLIGPIEPVPIEVNMEYQGKNGVICAVCSLRVKKQKWDDHNLYVHKYLAWIQGDTPLDINNESVVIQALTNAKKRINLVCNTCGEYRASVVGYLSHISICQKTDEEIDALRQPCPVCNRVMLPQSLKVHMINHTRVPAVVEIKKKEPVVETPLISESGERKKRKAAESAGETLKKLKSEIIMPHVSDFYKKPWNGRIVGLTSFSWKKQLAARNYATCARCGHNETDFDKMQKHYISTCKQMPSKNFECMVCKTQCATLSNITEHVKEKHSKLLLPTEESDSSDTDHMSGADSNAEEESSSDSSHDIEEEDDVEEEEEERYIKKKLSASRRKNNSNQSLADTSNDTAGEQKNVLPTFDFTTRFNEERMMYSNWNTIFIKKHHSEEPLFHNMKCNPHRALSLLEAEDYYPESKVSCNMANATKSPHSAGFDHSGVQWRQLKLFEADLLDGVQTLWCGGPVWSVGWVPGNRKENFLAVITDRNFDSFYKEDVFYAHKGVIQIWNIGKLQDKLKKCTNPATFAMAIVHSHGMVWDMDWCPSGCNDDCKSKLKDNETRMGLLAVACSNGLAYVYAVANPTTLPHSESQTYATDPVAILKLQQKDSSVLGGGQYHATKVNWSQERGHKIIAVGYTNGLVALFDLSKTSVLLTTKQGNSTVLLPFYSFQSQQTSVTGLFLLPPSEGSGLPPVCVTSSSGCAVWNGRVRLYWKRGTYAGASLCTLWPQVVAYTEEIMTGTGMASTLPVRLSRCHIEKSSMVESGIVRGCVVPWSGALLGLGLGGQVSVRRLRTPYISKDRNTRTERFPTSLWVPEIMNLNSESKEGEKVIVVKQGKKNVSLKELSPTFEELHKTHGILFVSDSKNPSQSQYSIGSWPMWEQLCAAVPAGLERHNFCAVGGRAGYCRISYVPEPVRTTCKKKPVK